MNPGCVVWVKPSETTPIQSSGCKAPSRPESMMDIVLVFSIECGHDPSSFGKKFAHVFAPPTAVHISEILRISYWPEQDDMRL